MFSPKDQSVVGNQTGVEPSERPGQEASDARGAGGAPSEARKRGDGDVRAARADPAPHRAALFDLRRRRRRRLPAGLEILLTKAPTDDVRELIRWTQTVVKHEALAVRRDRERILSGPAAAAADEGREDWVALIPADADGPPERAERREAVARSREALKALKPQELRALTLLAEGYSYAEIGEITGFSRTKINRCLAEGRERFRNFLSRSEDGQRCTEMGPLLSAFCDGEARAMRRGALREHLHACANCRATLRAYRAAPPAAAALAPTLPGARSLFDRAHEAFAGLASRLNGGGGATDSALSQVAATGGAHRARHGHPGEGGRDLHRHGRRSRGLCRHRGSSPAPLGRSGTSAEGGDGRASDRPDRSGPSGAARAGSTTKRRLRAPAEPAPQPVHHDPAPTPQPVDPAPAVPGRSRRIRAGTGDCRGFPSLERE